MKTGAATLGSALSGPRAGNLDALRIALAVAVIVSHAWPLALGPGTAEPLSRLTGHSLGGWAVALFFFLSGLLVTGSAERRDTAGFWRARGRRILPGLAAALAVTLALAQASGAAPHPAEALAWFARALTLVSIEHRIPGAFAANPYPEVVNGPLWSLFHEVAAYALCLGLVRAGLLRHRAGLVLLLAGATALWALAPVLPGRAAVFAPLFLAFALGMVAWRLRDRLPLWLPLAALALPLALFAPWPLAVAAAGYAALVICLRAPAAPALPDLSFGLYLHGWPVAQTIAMLWPGIAPAPLALTSIAAALPLAWLSWTLVERPALSRRRRALA